MFFFCRMTLCIFLAPSSESHNCFSFFRVSLSGCLAVCLVVVCFRLSVVEPLFVLSFVRSVGSYWVRNNYFDFVEMWTHLLIRIEAGGETGDFLLLYYIILGNFILPLFSFFFFFFFLDIRSSSLYTSLFFYNLYSVWFFFWGGGGKIIKFFLSFFFLVVVVVVVLFICLFFFIFFLLFFFSERERKDVSYEKKEREIYSVLILSTIIYIEAIDHQFAHVPHHQSENSGYLGASNIIKSIVKKTKVRGGEEKTGFFFVFLFCFGNLSNMKWEIFEIHLMGGLSGSELTPCFLSETSQPLFYSHPPLLFSSHLIKIFILQSEKYNQKKRKEKKMPPGFLICYFEQKGQKTSRKLVCVSHSLYSFSAWIQFTSRQSKQSPEIPISLTKLHHLLIFPLYHCWHWHLNLPPDISDYIILLIRGLPSLVLGRSSIHSALLSSLSSPAIFYFYLHRFLPSPVLETHSTFGTRSSIYGLQALYWSLWNRCISRQNGDLLNEKFFAKILAETGAAERNVISYWSIHIRKYELTPLPVCDIVEILDDLNQRRFSRGNGMGKSYWNRSICRKKKMNNQYQSIQFLNQLGNPLMIKLKEDEYDEKNQLFFQSFILVVIINFSHRKIIKIKRLIYTSFWVCRPIRAKCIFFSTFLSHSFFTFVPLPKYQIQPNLPSVSLRDFQLDTIQRQAYIVQISRIQQGEYYQLILHQK
ncbi:putative signal peptide protein [Puccinia sorghi]|uniref:Putative signal peptide protein n=1 Tax=Puccinia sorghi TaxID=27349 RepID=A0A0L6UEZ2_9BASI|nr:putative signal peptide protein [Puccinia sorghi]